MIHALEIQSNQQSCLTLSFEERFQLFVDYTYQEKYTNKVKRLIKVAKFRFPQANVVFCKYFYKCNILYFYYALNTFIEQMLNTMNFQ